MEGSPVGDGSESFEVTRSDAECDRLTRELSEQAAHDHPAIVRHLDGALAKVLRDMEIDPESGFVKIFWVSPGIAAQIRPWERPRPIPPPPGDWWTGLVYLQGQRRLMIDLDAMLPAEHLPYLLALYVQTTIQEEVRAQRPRCPPHRHALSPAPSVRGAVWECPQDGQRWWCWIGSYHQALEGLPPGPRSDAF